MMDNARDASELAASGNAQGPQASQSGPRSENFHFVHFSTLDPVDDGQGNDDQDDEDEDSDDDVDYGETAVSWAAEPGPRDIQKERSKLLADISEERIFDDAKLREKYGARVRSCIWDDKNMEEPTLLHYIVLFHANLEAYGVPFHANLEALNFIVRLALEEAPEQLEHRTKMALEAPLHVAIRKRQERLVRLICELVPETAGKAISLANENGETCLHLAIKENLGVATFLVQNSHSDAFRRRRNLKAREGAGHTPLHDAVKHSRYWAELATCLPEAIPKCGRCREARKRLESSRNYQSELVESLLEKGPEALTVLNAMGQSPYMYYLSTSQRAQRELGSAGPTPSNPNQGRGFKDGKNNHGKDPKVDINIRTKARLAGVVSHEGAQGSKNPKSESYDTSRKPRAAKGSPKTGKAHQVLPQSYELANETRVEEHLREMSFAQGSFEKVCRCLFGDTGSDLKIRTVFRPQLRVSLRTPDMHDFLQFGTILAHAELDIRPSGTSKEAGMSTEDPERAREEDAKALCGIFEWLRSKNVKQIVKLVVKDNPQQPCSDDTIETCLRGFDVRYLDWNKADMCVDVIRKQAPNVTELWLDSSGNNTVFWSWSDCHGLRSVAKLKQVYLHARRGLETVERNKENARNFIHRLGQPLGSLGPSKIEVIPTFEAQPTKRRNRLQVTSSPKPQERHQWMINVRDFAAELRNSLGTNGKQREPKVALIDDGVNPDSTYLSERISEHGWPLDEPKSSSAPFYTSKRGHGTKMAKLICHVCPFARLYVAKLDGWEDPDLPHPAFTAGGAALAVRWAIEQQVNVICMSWNIKRSRCNEAEIEALSDQIKAAANANIIMYCAAQDEGQYGGSEVDVYPAGSDTSKLKIIGGADPSGRALHLVNSHRVHYLFPGEAVLNNETEKMKGSSAATALAAGTAAMILFCYEAAGAKMQTIAHSKRMEHLFDSLKTQDKFVDIKPILSAETTPQLVVKECSARVQEIRDEEHFATRIHANRGQSKASDTGSPTQFGPPSRRPTGQLT